MFDIIFEIHKLPRRRGPDIHQRVALLLDKNPLTHDEELELQSKLKIVQHIRFLSAFYSGHDITTLLPHTPTVIFEDETTRSAIPTR